MNSIDFIRMSLHNSKAWAEKLLGDMSDAPLTQPAPNGGNHPLWLLGHLVRSESDLLDGFILGRPNRFPELEQFAMTSVPMTDTNGQPTMDELFIKFAAIRAATLAHLDTLDDSDLDQPSHAPKELGPAFATIGACFAAMCSHVSFHSGQAADARRAAGRGPLFA
ncbi:MAG: DinB family protein [Planctomycetaceae bacterium]